MDEKTWINHYLAPLIEDVPEALALKDDVGILPKQSYRLLVTTDAIAQGSHYLEKTPADALGWKVVAVNVSDIAAKGGIPRWLTLTCCFSKTSSHTFYRYFVNGLEKALKYFDIKLIGGDTLVGEKSWFSGTLIAQLEGKMLRSKGAKLGDGIFVSGTLGDAMGGLFILQNPQKYDFSQKDAQTLIDRYERPYPSVSLGIQMAKSGLIHAACDISDGVLINGQKIASSSQYYARIYKDLIPTSKEVNNLKNAYPEVENILVKGGDDYAMLFVASLEHEKALKSIAQKAGSVVTCIGSIVEQEHMRGVVDHKGKRFPMESVGYDAFCS